MRRARAQRGFTLVELMVVVAIIGVLAMFFFSVSTQPYGARPDQVAQNIAGQLNLAKMRAVATRKIQRVTIVPTGLYLEQATTGGFSANPSGFEYAPVQRTGISSGNVIWDVATAACGSSPCTGAPTAANSSLSVDIYFQPDGSSTGGTIYITDTQARRTARVSLYKATGGTLVRNAW